MSLKRVVCVASFSTAVALSLYGAGCSSSSPGTTPPIDSGKPDHSTHFPDASGGMDTAPEVSFPETSTSEGGAACTPPSKVTVTATLHPSPAIATSMCTAAIVNQIVDLCFFASPDEDGPACNALLGTAAAPTAAGTCFGTCIESDVIDPTMDSTATAPWGAILLWDSQGGGDLLTLNTGGCVASLDTSSTGQMCATDLEGNLECVVSACGSCTVGNTMADPPTDAQLNDYFACEQGAQMGACASFQTAAETDCATEMADTAPAAGAPCFAADAVLNPPMGAPTPTSAETLAALKVYFGAICVPGMSLDGG